MKLRGARAGSQTNSVLFDGSVLADGPLDGIRRYTHELLQAMQPLLAGRRYRFQVDVCIDGYRILSLSEFLKQLEGGTIRDAGVPESAAETKPRPKSAPRRFMTRMRRSIAKRLVRPRPGYRLLHLPLPNTFPAYRHYNLPTVVTVHDLCHLVCPESQDQQNCETLHRGMQLAEERRSRLIAVSHSTSRDLQQLMGIREDRVRVIYEACDRRRFRPVTDAGQLHSVRERYRIPEAPYFFSLCTLEPRKNLLRVVEAFRRFADSPHGQNHRLVLAGRAGWGDQQRLLQQAGGDRVLLIGHVADEDLPVLYSGATAFLCLSIYEGFGLPLLEAMSCGCPVVHSDRSALPEIAGGSGLIAAPDDVDAIHERMTVIASDAPLRNELRFAALRRAESFSWQRAADDVLGLYDEILSDAPDRGAVADRRVAA